MNESGQPDAADGEIESPFIDLLQRRGCARMLAAFLKHDGFWLTESQLGDLAEINQSTVNRNKKAFLEIDLIEARGDRPTEYRLNEDHPAVLPFLEAYHQLQRHIREMADSSESEDVDAPFYLLISSEGRVRIVNAFLKNDGFWLTESHLENLSGTSQPTVNRHLRALNEIGLLESRSAHPTEYRLDDSHPAVEPLLNAHRQLYREINTLDDHEWRIPVPTDRSARHGVQEALGDIAIDFGNSDLDHVRDISPDQLPMEQLIDTDLGEQLHRRLFKNPDDVFEHVSSDRVPDTTTKPTPRDWFDDTDSSTDEDEEDEQKRTFSDESMGEQLTRSQTQPATQAA